MKVKVCSKCKKQKGCSEFYRHKAHKDGFSSWCKVCRKKDYGDNIVKHRKFALDTYYKHKDKYLANNRARYNPEKAAKKWLQYEHGITADEYNKLFQKQYGCCAICGIHQSQLKRKLCVDHNHYSQRVRGLLCDSCNLGIGKLKSDEMYISLLQNAIEYLIKNDKEIE